MVKRVPPNCPAYCTLVPDRCPRAGTSDKLALIHHSTLSLLVYLSLQSLLAAHSPHAPAPSGSGSAIVTASATVTASARASA